MYRPVVLLVCSLLSAFIFVHEAKADEVVLKTGERLTGKFIFQNEQVIVLQDEAGNRLQFPVNDIKSTYKSPDSTRTDREKATGGQQKVQKITLKTGEVYRGEVVAENDRIFMLKTSDGNRLQIQKDGIAYMEQDFLPMSTDSTPDFADNKFSMLLDLSGGASYSRNSYGWAPAVQGVLVLGARDLILPNSFIGIGAGYSMLFPGNNPDEFINIIPLFVRLQSIIGKQATAPYAELDAGYGFCLRQDMGGGMLLRISVGVAHKFSPRTVIYAGLYGSLQGLSGAMRDIDPWGSLYRYDGNTITRQIGAKIALRF